MQEIDFKSALAKMAAYCSKSEQCIKNVRDKLSKWELSEKEKDEIINYLIQEKFIDEERYTLFYVKDKHRFQHWGKNKIAMMLQAKGIKKNIIEDALSNIEEIDYNEQLYTLLRNKFRQLKFNSLYEAKGKLYRFGCSRGFESDIVIKISEKVINESNL